MQFQRLRLSGFKSLRRADRVPDRARPHRRRRAERLRQVEPAGGAALGDGRQFRQGHAGRRHGRRDLRRRREPALAQPRRGVADHRQRRPPRAGPVQRPSGAGGRPPHRPGRGLDLPDQRPRGAGPRRAAPVRRRLDRRQLPGPGAPGPDLRADRRQAAEPAADPGGGGRGHGPCTVRRHEAELRLRAAEANLARWRTWPANSTPTLKAPRARRGRRKGTSASRRRSGPCRAPCSMPAGPRRARRWSGSASRRPKPPGPPKRPRAGAAGAHRADRPKGGDQAPARRGRGRPGAAPPGDRRRTASTKRPRASRRRPPPAARPSPGSASRPGREAQIIEDAETALKHLDAEVAQLEAQITAAPTDARAGSRVQAAEADRAKAETGGRAPVRQSRRRGGAPAGVTAPRIADAPRTASPGRAACARRRQGGPRGPGPAHRSQVSARQGPSSRPHMRNWARPERRWRPPRPTPPRRSAPKRRPRRRPQGRTSGPADDRSSRPRPAGAARTQRAIRRPWDPCPPTAAARRRLPTALGDDLNAALDARAPSYWSPARRRRNCRCGLRRIAPGRLVSTPPELAARASP